MKPASRNSSSAKTIIQYGSRGMKHDLTHCCSSSRKAGFGKIVLLIDWDYFLRDLKGKCFVPICLLLKAIRWLALWRAEHWWSCSRWWCCQSIVMKQRCGWQGRERRSEMIMHGRVPMGKSEAQHLLISFCPGDRRIKKIRNYRFCEDASIEAERRPPTGWFNWEIELSPEEHFLGSVICIS